MAKQLVTLRVEPDVWDAVGRRAQAAGTTRAALLDYTLAQAAGDQLPPDRLAQARDRWREATTPPLPGSPLPRAVYQAAEAARRR